MRVHRQLAVKCGGNTHPKLTTVVALCERLWNRLTACEQIAHDLCNDSPDTRQRSLRRICQPRQGRHFGTQTHVLAVLS